MSRYLLVFALLFHYIFSFSQQWIARNAEEISQSSEPRPTKYQLGEVNQSDLLLSLQGGKVELLMPDGSIHAFNATRHSNFPPELAARYPNVQTFMVQSRTNLLIKGRLDVSVHGIHGVLSHPQGEIYIDPEPAGGLLIYYIKDFRVSPELRAQYSQHEHQFVQDPNKFLDQKPVRSPFKREVEPEVILRKYRIAIACTGEYTKKHNGTREGALAAINTALNRINFVLESELAIRLELIEKNDSLIFLDGTSDPFTNGAAGTMAQQNNGYLLSTLGAANYDVGHVFGTECSGVVGTSGGVGIVCGGQKGYGSSCEVSTNDRFYIGIVCHELGHQFGAEHTWNNCPTSSDDQFNGSTAFEPGSGSTIMSYAGACGDQNVQGNSDPYYHGNSIEAIKTFITIGSTCGEDIATGNHDPGVEVELTNGFFIPVQTPFKLKAIGSDEDGDTITYAWEQFDPGTSEAAMSPIDNPKGNAPIFRSYSPSTNPTRFFPALSKVLSQNYDNTEIIPTYDRNLTFRATVRDNVADGGGVAWKQVSFKATTQAGPFVVMNEMLPDTIMAGDYMVMQWDPAGTDLLPVGCKTVNVLLSKDGGVTFSDTILANTPNDGAEPMLIPDISSDNARIMIEAADNVFYAVNDKALVIMRPTGTSFAVDVLPHLQSTCLPASISLDIQSFVFGGYAEELEVIALGLPEGAVLTSLTDLIPGQPKELEIDFSQVFDPGVYDFEILFVSPTGDSARRSVQVQTMSSDFSDMALLEPEQGKSQVNTRPTFTWSGSANATAYQVEVDISPAFTNPLVFEARTNTAAQLAEILDESTLYYWRVIPINSCGKGLASTTLAFHTVNLSCETFSAEDLPKVLSQSGITTIQSDISVQNAGEVSDVNIIGLSGFHDSFGDLIFEVKSPSGKTVAFLDRQCGFSNREFKIGFDDQSLTAFDCQSSLNGQVFQPMNPFSEFEGEATNGTWSLSVTDSVVGSGGRIEAWSVELCGSLSPLAPEIQLNDTLRAVFASTVTIDNEVLNVTDDEAEPNEVVYTIVTVPSGGSILLGGNELAVGGQFSQEDISEGRLEYNHTGLDSLQDEFIVTVIDGTGGWIAPFSIPITVKEEVVSIRDQNTLPGISIFPNPIKNDLYITNDAKLRGEGTIRIFGAEGSLCHQENIEFRDLMKLSLGQLPSGIYFLQLTSIQGTTSVRFVKH